MSTIGITPGMQGGTPGEEKIWPKKRILSQKEKEEKNTKQQNKERFLMMFKYKGKDLPLRRSNKEAGDSPKGVEKGGKT